MKRTQIQLGEAQFDALRQRAARKKCSVAACIRESVDTYLASAPPLGDAIDAVSGRFQPDGHAEGTDHDAQWADAIEASKAPPCDD